MGGGELARDFMKADLVDEPYIGMVPVLVSGRIPLFPPGYRTEVTNGNGSRFVGAQQPMIGNRCPSSLRRWLSFVAMTNSEVGGTTTCESNS